MSEKTKILILSSNPKDTARLRLDEEVREITEGLTRCKNREQFSIHQVWAVRLRDLRRAMLDHEPHIVHFCGHSQEQGLMVEDDNGKTVLVPVEALSGLFELFTTQIECVLLNACYSEIQAEAINKHINYVIGMTEGVNDKTAIEFAIGFYDALGAGKTFDEAFKFGKNAIQLYNIPQHFIPILKRKPNIEANASQVIINIDESYEQNFQKQRETIEQEKLKKITSRGYWEIIIHPDRFEKEQISHLGECKEIIRQSKVSLRGWDFPHYDRREEPISGIDYVEQFIDFAGQIEYWRYYQSGQFIFFKGLKEDWVEEDGILGRNRLDITPMTSLAVINTLYIFTEIFKFASHLASNRLLGSSCKIQTILHHAKSRKLLFFDSIHDLHRNYVCGIEKLPYEKIVSTSQLLSAFNELALDATIWVYQRFNWDNVNKESFRKTQEKFLAGQS